MRRVLPNQSLPIGLGDVEDSSVLGVPKYFWTRLVCRDKGRRTASNGVTEGYTRLLSVDSHTLTVLDLSHPRGLSDWVRHLRRLGSDSQSGRESSVCGTQVGEGERPDVTGA